MINPWTATDDEILAAFKTKKIGQPLLSDRRLGPLYDVLATELQKYPDDLLSPGKNAVRRLLLCCAHSTDESVARAIADFQGIDDTGDTITKLVPKIDHETLPPYSTLVRAPNEPDGLQAMVFSAKLDTELRAVETAERWLTSYTDRLARGDRGADTYDCIARYAMEAGTAWGRAEGLFTGLDALLKATPNAEPWPEVRKILDRAAALRLRAR